MDLTMQATQVKVFVEGDLMTNDRIMALLDLLGTAGATITRTEGVWEGKLSPATEIMVVVPEVSAERLTRALREWTRGSTEAAVMWTASPVMMGVVETLASNVVPFAPKGGK